MSLLRENGPIFRGCHSLDLRSQQCRRSDTNFVKRKLSDKKASPEKIQGVTITDRKGNEGAKKRAGGGEGYKV